MKNRKMLTQFSLISICYYFVLLVLFHSVQSAPNDTTIATSSPDTSVMSSQTVATTQKNLVVCGRANGPGADPNNGSIQETVSSEFPWLAFLYFNNSKTEAIWCTGSLIGSKWILTTASCLDVFRKGDITNGYIGISAGAAVNSSESIKRSYSIKNKIDTLFLHPMWNRTTLIADMALIRLKTDVPYTNYISPICLPNSADTNLVNEPVTIAGYGPAYDQNFDLNMRKATAKIVMNSQCEKIYKPTTSGNICITTDPLRSMCVGDPGGPVNYKNPDGTWSIVGIVALLSIKDIIGCKFIPPLTPRPFTRVSSYVDWINCMMSDSQLNCSLITTSTTTITTQPVTLPSSQSATSSQPMTDSAASSSSSITPSPSTIQSSTSPSTETSPSTPITSTPSSDSTASVTSSSSSILNSSPTIATDQSIISPSTQWPTTSSTDSTTASPPLTTVSATTPQSVTYTSSSPQTAATSTTGSTMPPSTPPVPTSSATSTAASSTTTQLVSSNSTSPFVSTPITPQSIASSSSLLTPTTTMSSAASSSFTPSTVQSSTINNSSSIPTSQTASNNSTSSPNNSSSSITTTAMIIITDSTVSSTIVTSTSTTTSASTASSAATTVSISISTSGSQSTTSSSRSSTAVSTASTEPFMGCDDSAHSIAIPLLTIIASLSLSIFIL